MYLKSIEIQGFKSFAHKMNFEFHNGITCIVGPNGSGKSNVSDAVRWVLGEQSAKQLRGGNMQDVIFAGTETRKPQSMASVAITLDNSDHKLSVDYDEVTVTRRLYRSGESEYLINKAPVRLRDVHELFYDTGIGKEGYSIIGQGRIDQIISGKQEDKRELFDEAAGIVKFKRRKITALRKLDNERQNLLRVNDILAELTSRLEPLKNQSEKAKEYLVKKDRLKDLDLNIYLLDKEKVKNKLDSIDEKLSIAKNDLEKAGADLEKTKSEYVALERDLENIEDKITHIHRQDEANNLEIQQLSGHLEVLKEQINSIETSGESNESRRAELIAGIKEREEKIKENKALKEKLKEEMAQVLQSKKTEDEVMSAIDKELEEANNEADMAKGEIIDILNQRAQVKSKLQRYDTLREQVDIRHSEIIQRELNLKEDEDKIAVELEEAKAAKDRVEKEITERQSRINKYEARIQEIKQDVGEIKEELALKNERFHKDSSRLESLRNITERYEGFSFAVQTVMGLKKEKPGIKGVVADIISTEKKYETAIETALGGNIRNVVTDTQETARDLIEVLKTKKAGRVTFLPLDALTLTAREPEKELLNEKGVIGRASDLINVGKGFEILPEYLLGRVVVIDNIESAIKLSKKYKQRQHMVTLAGEYFSPGGSMTGGAFKSSGNLLGRKREIEELERSVKALKKSIADIGEEIEEKTVERKGLQENSAVENEALHRAYIEKNTADLSMKQIGERNAAIKLDRDELEKEKKELSNQRKDISSESKGVSKELTSSEEREKELNDSIDVLSARIRELEEKKEDEYKSGERVRIEESAIRQKNDYIDETLERLEEEKAGLIKESEELLAGADENKTLLQMRNDEAEKTKERIEKAKELGNQNKENEQFLIDRKAEMKESHKNFFEKRDELSERISELDKECFRIESQREKLTESLDSQEAYIWEEYELAPSETDRFRNPELTDYKEIKKEISEVRKTIRGLGEVNVGAIEEYKALSERHEFLSAQHDDLIKSEDSLMKIIAELDKSMRAQFNEKFADINAEFDKAFKELFGGGKGSLCLEEGVDVLEADITIISQPPGKKLQNMMQLSGGEKSLTAIALLFAIQHLKPSPFCLLDEIEAALDDANVARFTGYLHKLTDNTQFIIITHRKGTMSTADRLYGITMQEKGVSALVSVNLVEQELDN